MGPRPTFTMKLILPLFALVAFAHAQGQHNFTVCGSGDALGISSATVTPDNPVPGQPLKVSFAIKPTQDLVTGDKETITVKLFGIALSSVSLAPSRPGPRVP